LAILSRLSRFPSPAVGKHLPFCVGVPLTNQSKPASGRSVKTKGIKFRSSSLMLQLHAALCCLFDCYFYIHVHVAY